MAGSAITVLRIVQVTASAAWHNTGGFRDIYIKTFCMRALSASKAQQQLTFIFGVSKSHDSSPLMPVLLKANSSRSGMPEITCAAAKTEACQLRPAGLPYLQVTAERETKSCDYVMLGQD